MKPLKAASANRATSGMALTVFCLALRDRSQWTESANARLDTTSSTESASHSLPAPQVPTGTVLPACLSPVLLELTGMAVPV